MRKMFVSACLFAAMAFTACTTEVIYVDSDGNPVENVDLKEGEGLLSVAVSSTDVSTRDVRPVGSSAAANNVNVVKVYVFSSTIESGGSYTFDNTVGVKTGQSDVTGSAGVIIISNFTSDSGEHTVEGGADSHVDQKKYITLTGIDKEKYYKFVAVGFHDADGTENPYGDVTPETSEDLTTFLGKLTTSNTLAGYAIEESFATQSAKGVIGENKNLGTLTLTRQVAGMLAYFKNVPATINGEEVKYVRVYANAKVEKFGYPAEASALNGKEQQLEKTLIMSFNVATLKTGTDDNGYYTFETLNGTSFSGTNKPLAEGYGDIAPADLALADNTIFGARYLIPYSGHIGDNTTTGMNSTLTIELQGASGDSQILRTLKVKTNQASLPDGATQYFYDIRCNNFYSIGMKLKTDTTTPGGGDPDEPIDLGGNSEILVQINDAWAVLHDMDVEE